MAEIRDFVAAPPSPEEDFNVVEPRPGVRVYDNAQGMIVIKNFSEEHLSFHEDEQCEHMGCSYVRIHPDDAERVVRALIRVKEMIDHGSRGD